MLVCASCQAALVPYAAEGCSDPKRVLLPTFCFVSTICARGSSSVCCLSLEAVSWWLAWLPGESWVWMFSPCSTFRRKRPCKTFRLLQGRDCGCFSQLLTREFCGFQHPIEPFWWHFGGPSVDVATFMSLTLFPSLFQIGWWMT